MGAYTKEDAERYMINHPPDPSEPYTADDIVDQPCILFSYKTPTGTFIHADIGKICPPPNSCGPLRHH